MRLSLPPITQSEQEFLFGVYASTRADEMAIVPWSDEQKTAFVKSQFQSQHQHYLSEYPNGNFQIIRFENNNIGRLYTCELENEIRIIDLTVLPEFRGKGVGTQLIKEILNTAEKPVRIYLESFNQSINLFTRLGFQIIGGEGIHQLWECTLSVIKCEKIRSLRK